jgi:site-specific recombinase XerD
MSSIDASEAVDRFLEYLRTERNVSPNTVRAYSSDLARYLEWAERSGSDPLGDGPLSLRLSQP